MNDSLTYAIFGCSFLCLGTASVICAYHYYWRSSRQKAQQEYVRFWSHLESMGFDYKVIMEVAGQMKNIKDFENANRRLEKTKRVPKSRHKNEPHSHRI